MTEISLPKGRDAKILRQILAGCENFEQVAQLGMLFHGTCAEIEGELHGGRTDGVFWTADRPSVAQAYIPRGGSKSLYEAPDEFMAQREIQPIKYGTHMMAWAQERAGVRIEDMDIIWNGMEAWEVKEYPENWPTYGDYHDLVLSLGYEEDRRGYFNLRIRHEENGQVMLPADYLTPGHLIIALPNGFSAIEPKWTDDAMGHSAPNRVGDFAKLSQEQLPAIWIEDELQSDFLGNVPHGATGILPAGLDRLTWLAIPAKRHDGPEWETFSEPETPEFVDFMKGLNPNYRSVKEIEAEKSVDLEAGMA